MGLRNCGEFKDGVDYRKRNLEIFEQTTLALLKSSKIPAGTSRWIDYLEAKQFLEHELGAMPFYQHRAMMKLIKKYTGCE